MSPSASAKNWKKRCRNGVRNFREGPLVAGFSFGGWVALSLAIDFPQLPGALILCNTEAKIDVHVRMQAYRRKAQALGLDGDKIARIVQDLATKPGDVKTSDLYVRHCLPLFSNKPYKKQELARCRQHIAVWDTFDKEEQYTFDFLSDLDKIIAPSLILAGQDDPEHPWQCSKKMADSMPNAAVILEIIKDAGDPVYRDKPEETLQILKKYISNTSHQRA